jgi:hypothetical protein
MLEPQEYSISYRLADGTKVERWYHHHAEDALAEEVVLTPDHGWLHEPVTIVQINCHPDDGLPGSAAAELYEPPGHATEATPPSTPVESL